MTSPNENEAVTAQSSVQPGSAETVEDAATQSPVPSGTAKKEENVAARSSALSSSARKGVDKFFEAIGGAVAGFALAIPIVLLTPLQDVFYEVFWPDNARLEVLAPDVVGRGDTFFVDAIIIPESPLLSGGVLSVSFSDEFTVSRQGATVSTSELLFPIPETRTARRVPELASLSLTATSEGEGTVKIALKDLGIETTHTVAVAAARPDGQPVLQNLTGAWVVMVDGVDGQLNLVHRADDSLYGSYYLNDVDGTEGTLKGFVDGGIVYALALTIGDSINRWYVPAATLGVSNGFLKMQSAAMELQTATPSQGWRTVAAEASSFSAHARSP